MSSIWTLTVVIPDNEEVDFAIDPDFNRIGIVVDAPPIAQEDQ